MTSIANRIALAWATLAAAFAAWNLRMERDELQRSQARFDDAAEELTVSWLNLEERKSRVKTARTDAEHARQRVVRGEIRVGFGLRP